MTKEEAQQRADEIVSELEMDGVTAINDTTTVGLDKDGYWVKEGDKELHSLKSTRLIEIVSKKLAEPPAEAPQSPPAETAV